MTAPYHGFHNDIQFEVFKEICGMPSRARDLTKHTHDNSLAQIKHLGYVTNKGTLTFLGRKIRKALSGWYASDEFSLKKEIENNRNQDNFYSTPIEHETRYTEHTTYFYNRLLLRVAGWAAEQRKKDPKSLFPIDWYNGYIKRSGFPFYHMDDDF